MHRITLFFAVVLGVFALAIGAYGAPIIPISDTADIGGPASRRHLWSYRSAICYGFKSNRSRRG